MSGGIAVVTNTGWCGQVGVVRLVSAGIAVVTNTGWYGQVGVFLEAFFQVGVWFHLCTHVQTAGS